MTDRIPPLRTLKRRLAGTGTGALMVISPLEMEYVAGWGAPGAVLLVPSAGAVYLFVDAMNYSQAVACAAKDIRVIRASGRVMECFAAFMSDTDITDICLDPDKVTLSFYRRLRKALPGKGIKAVGEKGACPDIISDMRMIKDQYETCVIKKAARETLKIWRTAKSSIKEGMRERDISSMVDSLVTGRGYINSFPTIAAAGTNTAYPHAVPSDKRIDKGEHVLVDFGIKVKGYCSDLTRIYYKGRINRQIRSFERSVRKAGDIAFRRIAPGRSIKGVAREVVTHFREEGFDKYLLHSLGHGVGLEVHEKPYLRSASPGRFKKGMVVTVEPGLYQEGVGGVRIEDMVLVTKNGCEVLTR